jgi:asparagine synthase (glutamine-hydrolysing)
MCGFVGAVFSRPTTNEDVAAVETAVRTLAHRGPDGQGIQLVEGANAVLGFQRLAIIDIEGGDQPMATGRGHHIVFNGEIYNYAALRSELAGQGIRFSTSSDTEVLLELLASRNEQALQELHGMFTLGFIDVAAQRLLLARDRLGIKQLYYVEVPDGFFFASEPKGLLALPWVEAHLNEALLPAYFAFRCAPSPDTLFQGIRKLPPGHILTRDLAGDRMEVRPFWQLPTAEEREGSWGESLDGFEAAFLRSVERRLVADVPVGAFLSGGLDSSLVVAATHRLGRRGVHTYSATFPGSPDDEAEFARRVGRRFSTEHSEYPTAAPDFLQILPEWVDLNDDLVADASSLPLMWVSRLARASGCYVLLSGEGADELFAGYGSYHKFRLLRSLSWVFPSSSARKAVMGLLLRSGALSGQDKPRVEEYFIRRNPYMGTAAVLAADGIERLFEDGTEGLAAQLPTAAGHSLPELCAFDFVRRIPDDLLVRTDRATMGASVEARVPFLDHELVELAFRFPSRYRAVPGMSKILLRRLALRWNVPIQTVVHRKIGFQLPIGDWFRGPMRPMWQAILADRVVPSLAYDRISRLVEAHQQGEGRFEELLWRVASLELWYRRWIAGETALSELLGRNAA